MTLRTALLASVTMLALAGCSETDDGDKADDTGTTDGDTDAPVDEDGDGSPAGEDCDDSDPAVFPGADEVCDGVDNDCDDLVDAEDDSVTDLGTFYADADGDSYGDLESPVEACEASAGVVEDSSDCDDANSEINPAAEEVCDAVDNDCDGVINGPDATDATDWYPDVDTDGFGDSTATPTRECDAPSGTV
ncbi:MAG: putative metal-binding motif-containing protein, partial [Myxococcota bacterium]|nr:putative metal-binding motif-containing protein [Myxococcota bacterium]